MSSDEELYKITSENCPFRTRIYFSYRYIETCTLIERSIKPYRKIENYRVEVPLPKYKGCKLPRFYNYYMCYPESKGEECLFLKRVNRYAKQISTKIDKKRLTDDLIPYLKLHNLIKKVKLKEYDDIIRCVAEYCFETGWDARARAYMKEWEVGHAVSRYIKRIMRNIKEATVAACLEDKSCPYKPLISNIQKRSILMEEK